MTFIVMKVHTFINVFMGSFFFFKGGRTPLGCHMRRKQVDDEAVPPVISLNFRLGGETKAERV